MQCLSIFQSMDSNGSESDIKKLFPVENIRDALDLIPADARKVYGLEVELKYSQNLHDEHFDYPFAPENKEIHPSVFSPFMNGHFYEW